MANTNMTERSALCFMEWMDLFHPICSGRSYQGRRYIIIPLLDVNFGMAAGAFNKQTGNNAAGGIGAKLSPAAVLVISNGKTRLVNIKNQDASARSLIWHLRSLTGSPASLRRKRQRKKSRLNRR